MKSGTGTKGKIKESEFFSNLSSHKCISFMCPQGQQENVSMKKGQFSFEGNKVIKAKDEPTFKILVIWQMRGAD